MTRIAKKLGELSSCLFDLLFPSSCILCHKASRRKLCLCVQCETRLPWIKQSCICCGVPQSDNLLCPKCFNNPPPFRRLLAPFEYCNELPYLAQGLKFSAKFIHATVLASLMVETLAHEYTDEDWPEVIIPVPLHHWRLRRRGFNQAIELAKLLSRHLGIPYDTKLVTRNKATTPQMQSRRQQRFLNVKGIYDVTPHRYRRVAVLDDVVTTGATVGEISRVLVKSGVEVVDVWCVARRGLQRTQPSVTPSATTEAS